MQISQAGVKVIWTNSGKGRYKNVPGQGGSSNRLRSPTVHFQCAIVCELCEFSTTVYQRVLPYDLAVNNANGQGYQVLPIERVSAGI